ncbi:MAG: GNAT family acetyltransferase [Lachnospiraceae bacterium]|nr:GNAT family acetyltransferase [Lachnospiraceae bacterium]MDE6232583.1 GNAT family acetyltransferase [Lachnospiraceae bacterium]MDE6252841.1 GNAT family acetyltransferase [Lachnospiraceae bacterium]
MLNDVTVFNIREYLSNKGDKDLGEDELRQLLSEFFCDKNPDVERFLKEQSIEFTKKNQSVTYLVFSNDDASLVGYFTLTIKPITVNAENFSNTIKRKIARVSELDEENGTYTLSAYLIAQLGKNYKDEANEKITGEQLLQAAVDTIKEIQYMAGGMVIFLEAEDKEKLMHFYEDKNEFKRFDTKETKFGKRDTHTLVQLLKVL